MNKSKVYPWICLLVLLFSGCEDASDGIEDQAPTPIEEERQMQDPMPVQAAEAETPVGVYFEEARWGLQFGEAEIYDGNLVVGAYLDQIAYFELDAAMKRFGWSRVDDDGLKIQKGELQYSLDQGTVQRTFLDERGSPYGLQFPLRNANEKTMIAQYDMEKLFGLQSRWNPEDRTLTLVEWGFDMPEAIEALAFGDRMSVSVAFRSEQGNQWIMDTMPSIHVNGGQSQAFYGMAGGHSQNGLYMATTSRICLIPGQPWTGTAWVMYQSRPIGLYPVNLAFDAGAGEIEISQGPWVEFTLEAPADFYTVMDPGLAIEGATEDEAVEIEVSVLEKDVFRTVLTTELEGEGPFAFSYGTKETGIYRIEIWTRQDGIRQERTHFYAEKE